MSRELAMVVRSMLTDPADLCGRLELLKGAQRQAGGVLICCPVHGERNPSCSVTVARDGTIRVKCFACDFGGDALSLIAAVADLSLRTDFREVLAMGAQLAGNVALAFDLRQGKDPETIIAAPERPAKARLDDASTYPVFESVGALWGDSVAIDRDGQTVKMMMTRGLDFCSLADMGLARVIPFGSKLPKWAMYRGRTWLETGHRLVLPSFDHQGAMRSVRAWRVRDGESPKRLPPAGHKQAGLVQANLEAVQMLRGRWVPLRLWIVEGEPDFLSMACARPGDAVVGIGSGSWTADHAANVPSTTRVMITTHRDRAGHKYERDVVETIGERCEVLRWKETG